MSVQFLGVRVMFCGVERPSLQLLVFTLKRLERLQQLRMLGGDRIRESGHVQRKTEYSTGPETPRRMPLTLLVLIVGAVGTRFFA